MDEEPLSTTEKSKKIGAISKEAVHRICSGQVVFDLAIAVKELVENSLDSGATIIDVKLIDSGKTCISVCDNGSGVSEGDFEGLGLKHHTSKLREFSDLTEVDTFGFRGEALSSLCSLSDLSIVTRHSDSEHGYKLEFERNGTLRKKEACARDQGTTVYVRNIFKNLPVRAKEFQKNIRKEYARTIQVLYGYCLVSTDTRITCTNSVSGKPPNLIVATTNGGNILKNINAVFGRKSLDGLIHVDLQSPDKTALEEFNLPSNVNIDFEWECYVSSCIHTLGRSTPDRQFFYINGRPCDLVKVNKLINQVYHKYNNKQYPFIFLNLKLNQKSADINVTPDKRTIFFTQEQSILATLKFNLIRKWDTVQGNFRLKPLTELNFGVKRAVSPPVSTNPPAKKIQYSKPIESVERKNEEIVCTRKNNDFESNSQFMEKISCVKIPISIDSIKSKFRERKLLSENINDDKKKIKYRARIEITENSEAEKELQRELTKESFKQMKVIGQFNLGFIVTRLEDDLFIIDQHASDEKYQFERLSSELKLKTQKLIIPKHLNLTSLNETILIENQQIFENNGFIFKINTEANTGQRVELIAMPVSGNWQFGQEDIEELIFLIREDDVKSRIDREIPCPTRVRQMLASRACRSAVVIGTALNEIEMQKLVTQMSEMKNPWNCPHGRPTMRHLVSLYLINR